MSFTQVISFGVTTSSDQVKAVNGFTSSVIGNLYFRKELSPDDESTFSSSVTNTAFTSKASSTILGGDQC